MNAPRNILFLRAGALGDFVLTLPAIAALRRTWPKARIELVARPEFSDLALAAGLAERAVSVDSFRVSAWFLPGADLSAREKDWLESFDIAVCCFHDPDRVVRANLIRAGVGRVLSITPKVVKEHAIDHFLTPLRAVGVEMEDNASARLELPAEFRERGREILDEMDVAGRVLAIQPGSGSPEKNWPLRRFLRIAQWFERERIGTALFILGEADASIAEAMRAAGSRFPALKDRPLLEIASVLTACSCYAGNDSGITHLAAALRAPTAALFGPTNPALWAPRGANVSIVSAPCVGKKKQMDCIGEEEVIRTIRALIAERT